ncbi:hypothetical protein OG21DRAFT_1487482 [Imleria badia]|nr:hypothetical protein OG21DRAFT_1487482 [Imleria badia]
MSSDASRDIVAEGDLPFTWENSPSIKRKSTSTTSGLVYTIHGPLSTTTDHLTRPRHGSRTYHVEGAQSHLKHVRIQASPCTLLLDTSPDPPALLPEQPLDPPYQHPVPRHPALTPTSLALKNTFWPTCAGPPMPCVITGMRTQNQDELPVVAHVLIHHQDGTQLSRPFFASTHHPLRHAALDIIRQVADTRAQQPAIAATQGNAAKNGTIPLDETDPCLMCTRALLHSRRVKAVFYLPRRADAAASHAYPLSTASASGMRRIPVTGQPLDAEMDVWKKHVKSTPIYFFSGDPTN